MTDQLRPDGTKKGAGWLGTFKRPDGRISTELSVGMLINGKEMDIPTLVPGLSADEVRWLLKTPTKDVAKTLPDSIRQKAMTHALRQISQKESPFGEGDF